jgi:hypothetical protein
MLLNVRRFRADAALRRTAIALQRERVLEYNIERTVDRTLDLYRDVLV